MSIENTLNKMRDGGLTIFTIAYGKSDILLLQFARGVEYTDYIAGKIISENDSSWEIIGVRVPIEGLSKPKTTSLLIKSQKHITISKEHFIVVK